MVNRKWFNNLLPLAILSVTILGSAVSLPRMSIATPQPVIQGPGGGALPLSVTLHGTGATFPAPIINFWGQSYTASNPNVTLSYAAVGSGKGQLAAAQHVGDFSASDAPLSPSARPLYPNILHIPETIGSEAIAYNLTGTGITQQLNFNGSLLASIFLGAVHLWDDPAIAALNPGVSLPHQNITTVHRQDGSGTTFIFTGYLSSQSNTWKTTPGCGQFQQWPTTGPCAGTADCSTFPCALNGNGNAAVAGQIRSHFYSLGYVELNYALCPTHPTPTTCGTPMTYGAVRNHDNTAYVSPSTQTTFYAAANYTKTATLPAGLGDWSGVSMLNQNGTQSYPIASFTYLLVYRELNVMPSMDINETAQFNALIGFLKWVITTGQTYSQLPFLSYVSLPPSVVALDMASINSIKLTINSSPTQRTFHIGVSSTGFNVTSIAVVSNDTVTLDLQSTDALPHQWYVDYNNNGVVDSNENNTGPHGTISPVFNSQTLFNFQPQIWNSHSVPSAGNFTFRDSQNPSATGTFTIIPQQIAIPFVPPGNNAAAAAPNPFQHFDSSIVATQGSLILNLRTNSFSGNITEITVVGTSINNVKNSLIGPLSFPASCKFNCQVLLVISAPASPNTLSSDITVIRNGLTGTATYALTRNLDIRSQGSINIVDVADAAIHYGAVMGMPLYAAADDVLNRGTIDIVDVSQLAIFFDAPAF